MHSHTHIVDTIGFCVQSSTICASIEDRKTHDWQHGHKPKGKIIRQEAPNSVLEGVYVETKILTHNLWAREPGTLRTTCDAIFMSKHLK